MDEPTEKVLMKRKVSVGLKGGKALNSKISSSSSSSSSSEALVSDESSTAGEGEDDELGGGVEGSDDPSGSNNASVDIAANRVREILERLNKASLDRTLYATRSELYGELFEVLNGEAMSGLTSSELQDALEWADTGIQFFGKKNEWRGLIQETRRSLESQEILILKNGGDGK
jgi:hypothetical protein